MDEKTTWHNHINITRYKDDGIERRTGYVGTIEPTREAGQWPSWIIFIRADNSGTLYTNRRADGEVVGQGVELPCEAHGQLLDGAVLEVEDLPPRLAVNFFGNPASVVLNVREANKTVP